MVDVTLKAYAVQEQDEMTGGIVFAKSNAEARRAGSSEFGDGSYDWGKATRVPWADEYATAGRVPFKVKFAHGWWQECMGCGTTIREEELDDDGEPIEFDIVESGDWVFCTPCCRDRFIADRVEDKRIAAAVIADLTDRVLRAMPGAVICDHSHVYVQPGRLPRAPKQAYVEFTFPGQLHGTCFYRFDKIGEKPHVNCPRGDVAAFYAWRAAGYPPHLMDASEAA